MSRLQHVDEGGPPALSLKAIGKAMDISGPAVYCYLDSRDDLFGAVLTEAHSQLAAAGREGEAAAAGSHPPTDSARLPPPATAGP